MSLPAASIATCAEEDSDIFTVRDAGERSVTDERPSILLAEGVASPLRTGEGNLYITPSSNNIIKDGNVKVAMFSREDRNGFAMTIMAMGIVFSALLLLSICFYIISKIGERVSKVNKVKSQGQTMREVPRDEHPDNDSGEVMAAIVMALHEHLDTNDRENTVLTINKVKRAYSPWSSKIYSMRELPHR